MMPDAAGTIMVGVCGISWTRGFELKGSVGIVHVPRLFELRLLGLIPA